MNKNLQKEIVKQIFARFGLLTQNSNISNNLCPLSYIINDEFVIDKRISFIEEDKKYQNKLWAATADVENQKLNILVADTSTDILDYTIIIQMNKLSAFAIRGSVEAQDSGLIAFKLEKWSKANMIVQAKCLFAIESLAEHYLISWQKLKDYKLYYDLLIEFLKIDD